MSKVLVTGSAGFIGFFVCKKFLDKGFDVVGIDNLIDFLIDFRQILYHFWIALGSQHG